MAIFAGNDSYLRVNAVRVIEHIVDPTNLSERIVEFQLNSELRRKVGHSSLYVDGGTASIDEALRNADLSRWLGKDTYSTTEKMDIFYFVELAKKVGCTVGLLPEEKLKREAVLDNAEQMYIQRLVEMHYRPQLRGVGNRTIRGPDSICLFEFVMPEGKSVLMPRNLHKLPEFEEIVRSPPVLNGVSSRYFKP